MRSMHDFLAARWDDERWGEAPSSPDLSQRQKLGLDGVSPHQVHEVSPQLFFAHCDREPQPMNSTSEPEIPQNDNDSST